VTGNKYIRRGELWAGVPAAFLRRLTQAEAERIAASAPHYVQLAAAWSGGAFYPPRPR
jgi:gamma-carbonic anhydrase